MIDTYKQITLGQFEAALAMLKRCVERCPEELWESKVAELTVRQVAYHTLFFVDFYLTASEDVFELRDLHHLGGDEREPLISPGLGREATLEYLAICHEKLHMTMAGESEVSLCGSSGFAWCKFTRAEIHLYNLRHVQHHAGQLSGHLRRLVPGCRGQSELRWISTGWR
jgi:hypothetical protein